MLGYLSFGRLPGGSLHTVRGFPLARGASMKKVLCLLLVVVFWVTCSI